VVTFGLIIENALQERDEVGEGQGRRSIPRYTLSQLLDPEFKLPMTDSEESAPLPMHVDGAFYDKVE